MIQYSADRGRSWHALATVRTSAGGYLQAHGAFVRGRLWRLKWVSAAGSTFTGAPIRAYTTAGAIAS